MSVTSVANPAGLPTYDDVVAAHERIRPVAHRTPVLTSRTANEATGASLFFKAENFQRAGTFKFRGAYNAVAALSPAERRRGVVSFSSGNHAQALALACRLAETRVTVVMPHDAPESKVAATAGYGADVVFYDRYSEDREAIAAKLQAEQGLALIPPFDHRQVIAGQGTAAKELFEDVGPLDVLVVCLGGGGLLAGSALSAHALTPRCEVIGVEPATANDGQLSLQRGEVVHIEPPRSIADGAITTHLGSLSFPVIQQLVRAIVTVSDDQLVAALRFFVQRMKVVVEPTGCLGAAAVFSGAWAVRGRRVGVILSGGNVDLPVLAGYLNQPEPPRSGQRVVP